jgi:acyl-coenzyme A thioesterase PaaI-like protein
MSSSQSSECLSDFDTQPWCRSIIENPAYVPSPVPSRKTLASSTENSLFGITLYTNTTIRACLNFWRQGTSSASTDGGALSSAGASRLPLTTENELTMLVSLGPHMNWHPEILHGGIAVMLMDEAVAFCILAELGLESGVGSGIFTRSLQVTYNGAVKTPGVVRVRAWKDTADLKQGEKWGEGRKLWTKVCIQDGEGKLLVEGKYLFMRAKGNL